MSSLSVTSGQTITTSTSISGTDDVAVAAGGTISVGTASPAILWSAAATGPGVTIENDGTITQTGSGANARPAIGFNPSLTGTLTVVNTGTISSTNGTAMLFAGVPAGGTENITNSGAISGGNGVAISFGAGNDTLTLMSGYSITGRVLGGLGSNTLNLSGVAGGSFRGATETAGSTVTFAGFDNFNTLNVQSGAWSLYGGGYYDTINISAGATLIVDEANAAAHGNPSDGGLGPLNSVLTINIGGTLRILNPTVTTPVLDTNLAVTENSATGPIILAGSGGVEIGGYFAFNPNTSFAIAGGLTALNGAFALVLGSITGPVTVNAGATVQLGYGGGSLTNNYDSSTYVDPGNLGSITGAIVDNGTLKVDRTDSYTLGGALTGSGVLQKLASGALTLQASTNFTGHVLMDGGTLNLAGSITWNQSGTAAVSSSGLAGAGAVTITNGGTLISQQSAAINMSAAPGNVTLNNSGTISGGTSLPVNNQTAVVLSNHNDTLINTGVINGLVNLNGGNDLLDSHAGTINGAVLAGGGTSTITLGVENNAVVLGAGTHTVNGGGGNNSLLYASAQAGVHVSLAQQGQTQATGVGTDTLSNFQNLVGSNYDDTLEGDGSDNFLNGGTGTNTVSYSHAGSGVTVSLLQQGSAQNTVGAGNDTLSNFRNLTGSTFADHLTGDANNNVIDGGGGADTLTGGLGADTFIYNPNGGAVVITDFSHAQGDRIDLSELGSFFSMADVLAVATQVGSDVVATRGGANSLTVKNVSLANLTAGDFILSPGGPTAGSGTPQTAPPSGGTVTGGTSNDYLLGQGGNDTLHGGAGSDYLDGGTGLNTATYDGPSTAYGISPTGGTVSGGPEGGADTLVNIQRIQFVDGYLSFLPTDTAGQVYRVYEATLNRAPDAVGLANWTHSLNGGTSLQSVVNGFVGSQEFQAVYGANLSNSDFVTLLYNNVLHRAPDQAGLDNWVSYLTSGAMTRAQVVLGFSESQEDIAALAAPIQQGVWIEDAAAAQVARLYDTVLGRLPDLQGLANWTYSLEHGTSLQTAADGFVGSQEFQTVYGALDNAHFVTLLYANVLHRAPDTQGLTNWVNLLTSGQDTRSQVVVGFSESPEHIANTAPHVDSGVWIA